MRLALWIFAALILAGCATRLPTDYAGPDAGFAVIGIGAKWNTQYSSYTFVFRRIGEQETGHLTYFQNNQMRARETDYRTNDEAGIVYVANIPAGNYEIINFSVFLNSGVYQSAYSSRKPFSIPFTVRAKEAVYLGNYQANGINGKNFFGMPVTGGAYFVVENRYQKDIELAKKRTPPLPIENAKDMTPNLKNVGSPFLITTEQAKSIKQ
ncbi:MAG: hypothetical protein ABL891_08490 [Burkholderiales bacterium]